MALGADIKIISDASELGPIDPRVVGRLTLISPDRKPRGRFWALLVPEQPSEAAKPYLPDLAANPAHLELKAFRRIARSDAQIRLEILRRLRR